jgi:FAD/FMN-containing dehydrogenase
MAFEAMWADFLDVAVRRLGLTAPFVTTPPITLLMETVTDGTAAGRAGLEAFLATAIEDSLASDALIAQSTSEAKRFWAYRESPYEYNRVAPARVGFDVSIPIGRMTEAVARMRAVIDARWPDATHVYYGHIADSNLHSIVMAETFTTDDKQAIEAAVYGVIAAVGGSVSAEHGIGRAKRAYLGLSRTTAELDLMRTLKAALDPKGILNPGRIL